MTAEIRNGALINVDIPANTIVGALVGSRDSVPASSSRIINRYATGIVRGSGQVGGLVGRTRQISIESSFADVNVVSTGDYAGGLVGWGGGPGPISDSYALGDVTGVDGVGGLVGYGNGDTVTNSYATGAVSGSTNLGGLIGLKNSGGGANNYYDSTTSGQSANIANFGTPQTTVQMMTEATFTGAGWDISAGVGAVWGIVDGSSYPYLNWQAAGTGSRP